MAKSNKEIFEQARQLYPHIKRGLETEWQNFEKVCKKAKFKPAEIVPLLKPAIEKQINWRKTTRDFVPPWKHFVTWINNHCWEEERGSTLESQKKPVCARCGKPAVYGEDGYNWCVNGNCHWKWVREGKPKLK